MRALEETKYKYSEIQYCLPITQLQGKRVESRRLYTSKLSVIDVTK